MPDAFRDTCIDTIAGAVAGGVSVVVSQPVDMVLTRFQHATCGTSPSSLARGLWAEGGLRTFWRGAGPLVWCVPLQNAMLFAGYGAGERWGGAEEAAPGGGGGVPPTLLPVFVGGCVGGLLQSFVVSPVEMIKIHMQFSGVHSVGLSGAVSACSTIGLPALWRGLGATCGRDVIPHGVWFATYELCKRSLAPAPGGATGAPGDAPEPLSARAQVASGATAATTAWLVGYPFDTIKTRIQAAAAVDGGAAAPGVVQTARAMLKESGGDMMRAYYRGFGLKLLRAIPMSVISFYVYEDVKLRLEQQW